MQEVPDPESAPMYEYCVSVLGRTYNIDCGLNVTAAGGSNAKAEFMMVKSYKSVCQRVAKHGEAFTQAEALKRSI